MVDKVKAYKLGNGTIISCEEITSVDAYKTSDGTLFENELEAYRYETKYLEDTSSRPIINVKYGDRITEVNGIKINENIKQYPIAELIATSCESIPEVPGVYMWYNIFESSSYSGSAKELKNRVIAFVNANNRTYAGKKINEIREKYFKVHNLAWVLLILEENVQESLLLERENFYINKFKCINCGYNTVHPIVEEANDNTNSSIITAARYPFSTFINRIKEWGYTPGESITIEEYAKHFREKSVGEAGGHNPKSRYLSFRVSAVMGKISTIEFSDLIFLPRKFIDIIDCGKFAFNRKHHSEIPSIIKYRKYDNTYIPHLNSTLSFKTAADAVKYCIETKKNELVNLITPEEFGEVYWFIKNLSINDFIDLCYHDAERLKNLMYNNVLTEKEASEALSE